MIDRYAECRLTSDEMWKVFVEYDFHEHTSP